MNEPIFFDCLTDAQCWSLFEAGVLQRDMLPVDVYERLERIAPDHGCYLFTWRVGTALPPLQDLIPSLALPVETSRTPSESPPPRVRVPAEQIRSIVEGFRAAVQNDVPPEGVQVQVISTNARLEIRAGPYLQPQARDLNAMSLPELETYLNDVLHLDEASDLDSADASTASFTPLPGDREQLRGRTVSGNV